MALDLIVVLIYAAGMIAPAGTACAAPRPVTTTWSPGATSAAITSMSLGFLTALFFMLKDGLDANTPIYYSLGVALVSFVVVSVLSPRANVVAKMV